MNGTLVTKVAGTLAAAAGAGLATWIGIGPTLGIEPAVARAWIDEPLDNSIVPVGAPVEILAHATDDDGVDLLRLLVDGDEEEVATAGGGSLVTVELTWEPPGAGTYLLAVVGIDEHGKPGEPGEATVTVGDPAPAADETTTTTAPGPPDGDELAEPGSSATLPGAGATTTPADPTTTTRPASPTTTTSTTVPSCARPAPGLTSPGNGRTGTSGTLTLAWSYGGCPVRTFRIEVSLDPTFPPTRTTVGSVGGTERSWQVQPALLCARTYHWRIRWIDQTQGPWSPTWSFTTGRLCG